MSRVLEHSFVRWPSSGVAGICLLCGSIAIAQDTFTERGIVAETERVIVTGTNIPTAETESALPVVGELEQATVRLPVRPR